MSYTVDNAILMAAGASSRFAPLSYEMPKALIPVKGERLIERQIRQLRDAGIRQVVLVVGYQKERFSYLKDKFGVTIVENPEYHIRNNHSSIYAAREYLGNSYICSSDNYFTKNPFETQVDDAYYAALYADGKTAEWCMQEGPDGYVSRVQIGGENAWYMLGHVFWTAEFSRRFLEILRAEYDLPQTRDLLWEGIYARHLDALKLKIRRYDPEFIFEFDSLDELRAFDESYVQDTRSGILRQIAQELHCPESELCRFEALRALGEAEAEGFRFFRGGEAYRYYYQTKTWGKETEK